MTQQPTTGSVSSLSGAVKMASGPAKSSSRASILGIYIHPVPKETFLTWIFNSSYMHDNWDTVQNTINYDNIDEQDGKDKDGAKIYVGWGKHAMFADRNTAWNDEFSQGCGREFRSRDWW